MESTSPGDREPEAIIIGAGPAGLWAAFQLGIHGVRSHLIDSQPRPGGQCAALYADKPVYDMPGFDAIDAGVLSDNLAHQLARFRPVYSLGDTVLAIDRHQGGLSATLASGQVVSAPFMVLATGLGPLGSDSKQPKIRLPDSVATDAGHVLVTAGDFETGCANLFAIGDAISYPGKLCLLVSACHEAALMAFAIRRRRAGEKRAVLEYSSTSTTLRAMFSS